MRTTVKGSGSSHNTSAHYKTPEYFHCVTDARFRSNVYEPEADTFLFMEALDLDAERLSVRLLRDAPTRTTCARRRCCVEIGCGSGTVLTHLGALLLQNATSAASASPPVTASPLSYPVFVAVDVNPIALEATAQTWTETMRTFFPQWVFGSDSRDATSTPPSLVRPLTAGDALDATVDVDTPLRPVVHTVRGDLFTALPTVSVSGTDTSPAEAALQCDVVLFNPPYVPTSMEELEATIKMEDIITAAWSGGPRGRVVLDRFLHQLPAHLARDGVCYIVLIKENDVEDVYNYIREQFRLFHGLGADEDVVQVDLVASRYTGEHLSVHRITYADSWET